MVALAGGVIYLAVVPAEARAARRRGRSCSSPRRSAARRRGPALRLRDFAWERFLQVAGWALLAYAVIAGMIEYAFVYDKTRGASSSS